MNLSLFFILGTETRQFLQFFPFIIFIFLDSIQKIHFNKYELFGIFAFQLVWSRFWYKINSPEGFLKNSIVDKNLFEYPSQKYFQFHGPWLSTTNSIIYGLIFIATFIIVQRILKSKSLNNNSTTNNNGLKRNIND